MTKFRDQQGRIHRLGDGGERFRGTPPSQQRLPEPQMTLDDLERLRDDIETIIDEIKASPALKDLQELIDLIGLNAETIIENTLRDYEFHDISRDHGDKISKAHTEITLLTEIHKVVAEQITELFARVDTTDASMQAQFLQVNQAIADEISARVSALTELHAQVVADAEVQTAALNQRISEAEATIESARASTEDRLQAQITDQASALNVRIDTAEANAASSLATTKQALITQFTAADGALNTALLEQIAEVETSAEEARVEQKNLILTQVNDSIGAVQQQVNTKVTASEASALASTQVEAFKNNQFASLQQQFNVVAGEHNSMYGSWYSSYSVKINAGTIGGKPVIAGIALSASQTGGSDFIIMADRMAIVSPYYTPGNNTSQLKYPFVVGTVGGVSTVGITGQLLVDGSITADKITTNTLSAITANAGTINGGTFKTHTLNAQGQVVNPTEFRVEISNVGTWPLWIGSGAKNANNAVVWVDKQGNAGFNGTVRAGNIEGQVQNAVTVYWEGNIDLIANKSNPNRWIPKGYFEPLTTFTLPAPAQVGTSHRPMFFLTVNLNIVAYGIELRLERRVKEKDANGNDIWVWKPYHNRGNVNGIGLMNTENRIYTYVGESQAQLIHLGAATGQDEQFRISVKCSEAALNSNAKSAADTRVVSVYGFVVGIR